VIVEIISPSDAMSLEHEDREVLIAAGLLLGRGQLALERWPRTDKEGHDVLPLLLFGGGEKYIEIANRTLKARPLDVAECLEGLVYGQPGMRQPVLDAVAGQPDRAAQLRYLDEHNDRMRTSLRDYAVHARGLATSIRERERDEKERAATSG